MQVRDCAQIQCLVVARMQREVLLEQSDCFGKVQLGIVNIFGILQKRLGCGESDFLMRLLLSFFVQFILGHQRAISAMYVEAHSFFEC